MLENGDAEFVKVVLDREGGKASLKQKSSLRKIFVITAALFSFILLLSGEKSHGSMVLIAFFQWFLFLRLDSDIKL